MTRAKFIQTAIVLCGEVGIFFESPNGAFLYCTNLDVVWYLDGLWFLNGEYGPNPFKLL